MNVTQSEYSHIPPVKGLHKMIRGSGYEAEDCILEYVDNSIDAKATSVDILLYGRSSEENTEMEDPTIERILIIDEGGNSMNSQELLNALTIAFTRNHREEDIGAYGFGMKSASLNLGNELLVLSKQSNSHDFVGARVDFVEQERYNDYSPTQYSQKAQNDLFPNLQKDIRNRLLELVGTDASVTVISVSRLHLDLASTSCELFRQRLLKRLRTAYSVDRLPNFKMSVQIIKNTIDTKVVERVDPFYLQSVKEHLRKEPVEIQLYAVIPNRQTDPVRIIEKNTIRRAWRKGTLDIAYTHGTVEKPIFYDLNSENLRLVDDPMINPPPDTKTVIPFQMVLAFLTKETYDTEDDDLRKKGIWFQRGPRMVAQGLTLGIHGITAHGHYNQMRACVRFPPSMDKLMGAKYNKGINPKQGPLKEGIIRIWKDITSVWVKEKEAARNSKKDTTSTTQENILHTLQAIRKDTYKVPSEEKESGDVDCEEKEVEKETVQEKVQEPPQIIVFNGKVSLRVNEHDIASVDGLGMNSHLRTWLDRVLKRKGVEKTKELIQTMESHLH